MTKEIIKEIEKDYWEEKADPIDMAEVFDLAIKALEQTPPKGKWIDIGIAMEGRKHKNHECDMANAYCCDYCGYNQYIKTNYCPWCGAEMEGKEGEEDE